MSGEQEETFADICVLDVAISRNTMVCSQIDKKLQRLNHQRDALLSSNKGLEKSRNEQLLNLMNAMSHRRFCRLMRI